MLSYRHGFDAGNPADVFKHTGLDTLISAMQKKPTGITFIASHSDPALAALDSEWALKTLDFEPAISRRRGQGPEYQALVE